MTESPRVSVVIPTRNRLTYLREAVASVRQQSMKSWELVIVDDDSSDGTREWLREARGTSIRVVEPDEHRERSAARNLGLRQSKGTSVLFLDDDDRLTKDALHRLSEELDDAPDAVAAVGAMLRFDERGVIKRGAHARRRVTRDVWPDVLTGWVGTTGRSLLRRRALERIGGFDEQLTFAEDWEMWLRLSREGSVVLVPDVVLEYRVHPDQSDDARWREVRDLGVRRHLAGLSPQDRMRADQVLRARDHHAEGLEALARDEPRAALRHFLRAARADRSLYVSPLQRRRMRDPLLRALATAPLGRGGIRVARRMSRRSQP